MLSTNYCNVIKKTETIKYYMTKAGELSGTTNYNIKLLLYIEMILHKCEFDIKFMNSN